MVKASYIFKSSCIFNSVDSVPTAGGIAVKDKKIIGVFSEKELRKYMDNKTKVVDYGDRTILPGFIDSHTHTGNFMEMADPEFCVDVGGCKTFSEVMDRIKNFAQTNRESFVYAVNFNLFDLEDEITPNAKNIDKYIDDQPVLIMTWDCHTWFANGRAIEAAGITDDLYDPAGSAEKDENGKLTGVFHDTAAYPLQMLLVRDLEARKKSLAVFLSKMNAAGITTIGDVYPYGVREPYTLYKAMDEEDKLTVRICFYPSLMDLSKDEIREFQKNYHSDMLRFSGLKAILDGVLTVHTAWMLRPYSNRPETCGGPVIDAEKLKDKIMEACSFGINCRIHAIGDGAIRFTLDCYEQALNKYGPIRRRHTIEHVEYCDPLDVPRFGQLNVIADMHPRHLTFYIDNAEEYLGNERESHTWLMKDIMDSGGIIGTGSDYPVVDFNPMLGIYAAVARAKDDGRPKGGWHPEQKLTIAEILKIYTAGSAAALNIEKETGTLEAGKSADLIVLDCDIFKASEAELLGIKPVMTMVAGKIVYSNL